MGEESFETSNNLENLLSPFCYEPETPLPKTNPEVPGGIYLSGFISQDCNWGCCFNHSVIKCFPVDKYFEDNQNGGGNHCSNSSVAVSSRCYTFSGGRITCATELAIHNQRTSSGARKLLLGISYSSENNNRELRGAVVIFDPICCVPMKWIEIPDPVSSITVLSHFEEGGSSRPFFNETLMAMVGIAAVGLRGGSVIIVDLGLDDPSLANFSFSNTKSISDVSYRLLYVNPHEYVIATKRHKAVSKRSLIALRFTNEPEDEVVSDGFHYCNPNGESILMLPKNSVAVTCIEYVPAIGSLLVGFTCGGFQIWRVNNMELQFSSDPVYFDRNLPVFGFSFQQPVDDPKNYCYVWVMFGNNSNECSSAHVELYCLYYENKAFIDNFGFTYDGFKQCTRRMTIPLVDDFLPTNGENEENSIRCNARPLRIWTQPDSLMCCAWEVGRGGIFYMGAFDLNQWYSNHTKECIVYNSSTGLCPYWVALPVETSDNANLVLDVRIIPKSLMRWENPHAKLDIHLYPASISFRAVCLTNNGVSAFEHFGVQEKLIRIMLKEGPNLMIQPTNLKNAFLRYGLEPIYPQVYGEISEKNRDRFLIFSVLLESRRTSAIVRLASAWLDGSFANVGCTIDLIIDWIGSYMTAIRSVADPHWESLLTFADDTLPPETIDFISCSNFAWTSLHKMLSTLMNPTEVYSARGLELEDIEFGLGKLVQYSAALLMLHKAKFLPENDRSFITTITEHYRAKRNESRKAIETSIYIDSRYKKTHPLMIDHLMDSLMMEDDIKAEWHVSDGEYLYPPQHVGYLVNMFMWPDADPRAVSRVFMYFLFDLNLIYLQYNNIAPNSDIERKVRGDFKAVLDCAAEDYSDVLCLWLLDQGMYDDVLVHLKEKDRLFESDGLPWCAAAVALTAAGYENDIAELLLKSCPFKLARLLFSLMSSTRSKFDTLAELMVSSNLGSDDELLQQFFEISEERDRLGEFIRKRSKELPDRIRESLLIFLNKSDSVKRMMQLLMYYVHTEQYANLEEEFVRARNALQLRTLSSSEKKLWTFQENYIMHVLNSTKESVVGRFLRLQTPQHVRHPKSTMNIKAIQAAPESPTTVPDRLQNESKLPPQLRRLRLSETYSSDPLSPLRRYAGKIQSMVSAAADSNELLHENHNRRYSRKSFGRRTSRLSICGNSRYDTTLINETIHEDRINESARSNVDLMSLLKTPALDHRSENRKIDLRNSNVNVRRSSCTATSDETFPQPPPVHSIMKEKDPSKPKVAKKVELRFENLSLHSSDEDDKEATIYEDAEDSFEETRKDNSARLSESLVDTAKVNSPKMNDSHASNESGADMSFFNASETNDACESENIPSQAELEVARPTCSSGQGQELPESTEGGDERQIPANKTDFQTNEPLEISSYDAKDAPSTIITTPAIAGTSQVVFSQVVETRSQSQSTDQENMEQRALDESCLKLSPSKNEKEMEEPLIRQRKSKSRTPKRETQMEMETRSETTRKSSRTSRSSSTSSTPTKESLEVQIKGSQRSARKSRSRTPNRELVESLDVSQCVPPQAYPTRSHEVDSMPPVVEPESKRIRRSGRNTRSITPAREIVEEILEEPTPTRRQTRLSRSRTPTRDSSASESLFEVSEIRSIRTVDKGRSEENEVTEEMEEEPDSKPVRRSARTSQSRTREMFEDESFDDLETTIVRRSTRVSRSRTPTRDIQEESIIEAEDTRRTLRARRSTTPNRDVQDSNQDDADFTSVRRVTRSTRSKTPTRDLEDIQEEPQAKVARRTRRTSKTPTREIEEEKTQESPTKAVRKRATKAKKSSVCSDDEDDDTLDEMKTSEVPAKRKKNQKSEVAKKPQKRRLKYFEHHQDLSTVIETDSITDGDVTASVLEATVIAPDVPTRRIKGIKARQEEPEPDVPAGKPTKRRKAVADELLFEADSEASVSTSTRSNRSTSSRKSTASSKSKGSRRKGRSASQSGS